MNNKFTRVAIVGTVLLVVASAVSQVIPLFIASSFIGLGVLIALTQVEDK